jgi:hypothetical protein
MWLWLLFFLGWAFVPKLLPPNISFQRVARKRAPAALNR